MRMSKDAEFCDCCGVAIYDGDPKVKESNTPSEFTLCLDCGLKNNYISAIEWLQLRGFNIYDHATYNASNGTITAFQKWGRGYRKDEIRFVE